MQRLVDDMHAAGLAASTVRNKRDPLRVVYRRASQDDEVTRNPPRNCDSPRTPRSFAKSPILTPSTVCSTPTAPRTCRMGHRVYAGVRVGELRALRGRHIDFTVGVIRVEAGWDDADGEQDTKTAAGVRIIPLVGRLRADLARHKLATGRNGDALRLGRTATTAFVRCRSAPAPKPRGTPPARNR